MAACGKGGAATGGREVQAVAPRQSGDAFRVRTSKPVLKTVDTAATSSGLWCGLRDGHVRSCMFGAMSSNKCECFFVGAGGSHHVLMR